MQKKNFKKLVPFAKFPKNFSKIFTIQSKIKYFKINYFSKLNQPKNK